MMNRTAITLWFAGAVAAFAAPAAANDFDHVWSCELKPGKTLDEARAYIARHDWNSATSADAAKDEERLTARLMQQRMKVDMGEGKVIERTVGEVMGMAE